MAMDDESVLDDASLPLGGKVEFCKYDMTTTMNTSVQLQERSSEASFNALSEELIALKMHWILFKTSKILRSLKTLAAHPTTNFNEALPPNNTQHDIIALSYLSRDIIIKGLHPQHK